MNNINTSFKKIYSLLILTFLCFLILINKTYSEEKIGSVVALKGEIIAINTDDEKRTLDIYDDIFLFDEIVTNNSSSATIQYDDNSTVIIKSSSSLTITEFVFSIEKKKFLGIVKKGKVIIESGKIAKAQGGTMEIQLPTMILGIKGTRFNMNINPDGTSEVGLSEDSFGEVGTINISSEGKVQTLYDTDQVISANIETGISERPKTDDEKKELVDASNDLIEASSIDDNLIQEKLEEKLANGTLLDANNDGIIDLSDIDIIKENIKIEKQENINFIVENSTGENTEFLSNVLNISDEASIGESMNQILETYDYLVASVITNLSNEDNTFLTTSNSEANNAIKEKIFTQMLNDSDDENNNIAVIGSIISRSDGATVERMVNYVELASANKADSNLSLQVLSSVADASAFNENYLETAGQTEVNRLIESAVANAGNNPENAMMLANVITKGDPDSIGLMIDSIQIASESNFNPNLSLQVLSSVADAAALNAASLEAGTATSFYEGAGGQTEVNRLIESAVANAGNNPENAMMLANVITKGDPDSIGLMIDSIQIASESNFNPNLSLQVLSSVADAAALNAASLEAGTATSFYEGAGGQTEVNRLIKSAVANAGSNQADSALLANVMTKSDADTINMLVDNIQFIDKQNFSQNLGSNTNTSLSLQVLSSVADAAALNAASLEAGTTTSFYEGAGGQTEVNRLIKSAVANAGSNQADSALLANVITKSDASTAGAMLDNIATVSVNNPFSTLAAQVLSSVATTAEAGNTKFNTETMSTINTFIDTATEYTAAATAAATKDDDASGTYDAGGFSMVTPFYHKDTNTAYNPAGFDKNGNTLSGSSSATETYDAGGFSMVTPFYHKDTNTAYNPAGFDKNGNTLSGSSSATETYDAGGFSTVTPYYHKVTGNAYNSSGFDKDGNTSAAGGSDPTVTWTTQASSSAATSYTTSDDISLSVSATTTGSGVTYSATNLGGLIFSAGTGILSGSPTVANSPYSIQILAQDNSCYPTCTGVSKITDTVSFTVTAAGGSDPTVTWTTQASSSAATSYTTSDDISLSVSATTTGSGVTYSATNLGGLIFSAGTGILSGSPTVANSPYSIQILAQDNSCYPTCTGVSKITDTVSFTVTAAGGSDPTVTWTTQASSSAATSYTTSDDISLSVSATTTGSGVTYSATNLGGLIFSAGTGILSGSPTVANSPYSIQILAQDNSCYPTCTGVSKITDTVSFTVTAAGSYDARGFSTVEPFKHKVTGKLRDSLGYNSAGFNASGWSDASPPVYNELYNENVSP